jgi:hypothetical protein
LQTERIVYNVQEAFGPYYIAVKSHNASHSLLPYRLTAQLSAYDPYSTTIAQPVPTSFTLPPTDTTKQTLILFNATRMNQIYTSTDTLASSGLITKLNQLTMHNTVSGVVIALDAQPTLAAAYALWDTLPDNPYAANYVAASIKSYLYQLAPRYPNWKYLVIVGPDTVIPFRRIPDEARVSNERKYNTQTNIQTLTRASFSSRYILTDDYYASLLPMPFRMRELYIPQLSVGRLVEKPSEIATQLDTYLAEQIISTTTALVTGYDFLTDEAQAISQTLAVRGIAVTQLINDSWDANALRTQLFGNSHARNELSLNSHFEHWRMIPATNAAGLVYANEVVTASTNFTRSLVFSVGCHSGLNVPDADANSPQTALDWAQAFAKRGATFIGNTGYGYGDSDLIAYSEQLALNFAQELNPPSQSPVAVGEAVKRAKQNYFNTLGSSAFSNYDEKVLAEWTLYGLPMKKVKTPVSTPRTTDLSGVQRGNLTGLRAVGVTASGNVTASYALTRAVSLTSKAQGDFYSVNGETQALAGRPVEPRFSVDVSLLNMTTTVAHGALIVGGRIHDQVIDPYISTIVTEAQYLTEPAFDNVGFYPERIVAINRLTTLEGEVLQRLVVVPGQFKSQAGSAPTVGTQRLWDEVDAVVYYAPYTNTDFIQPNIWRVAAARPNTINFTAIVTDASGVQRVTVLYRVLSVLGAPYWRTLELTHTTGDTWQGSLSGISEPVEYIVQAVDNAGNVAQATDYGNPFLAATMIYLPLIIR